MASLVLALLLLSSQPSVALEKTYIRSSSNGSITNKYTHERISPNNRYSPQYNGGISRSITRGKATWYCRHGISACHRDYGGGMYAAAGPSLRHGNWRGSKVEVCTASRCVVVTLIDTCACGGGRIIDLYSDAFRKLAPLSKGVLEVTASPAHKEKGPSRSSVPGRFRLTLFQMLLIRRMATIMDVATINWEMATSRSLNGR
jgi:rare lipoprotein A (peptidoglycan hydrolase)